jgi:hypothetical protein
VSGEKRRPGRPKRSTPSASRSALSCHGLTLVHLDLRVFVFVRQCLSAVHAMPFNAQLSQIANCPDSFPRMLYCTHNQTLRIPRITRPVSLAHAILCGQGARMSPFLHQSFPHQSTPRPPLLPPNKTQTPLSSLFRRDMDGDTTQVDLENRYPPPPPRRDTGRTGQTAYSDPSAKIWDLYLSGAKRIDKDHSESWTANTDGVLVFVRQTSLIRSSSVILTTQVSARLVFFLWW